jgi:long-chain acyl-CoA synthetase
LFKVRAAISLDDHHLFAEKENENVGKSLYGLTRAFNRAYKDGFYRNDVRYPDIAGDQLMEINYTSGTTGFSKGVMLTGNNLCGNLVYGINSKLHYRGSRVMSFLPLSHAYGCAFDMLVPLAVGSHITLLGRIPSPKILVKAMQEFKPNLVICVPLVLEKIYSKMIVPMISTGMLRWALAVPFLDNQIYSQIRNKLIDAFGGEFEEVIVGGAPFNDEVEDFLYKIKFPFTVGYGMTECGPLVSHTPWREFVPHSSGRVLPGLMECKILSDDPENIPGEICVRGENVMKGYFHNREATDKVLHDDGWLHTGDMGTLSADGTIFIRGRLKTMLLSSNGQNIYPEEIEAKLNNMRYVSESLVVEREGKLVALVYPDYETMDQLGTTRDQLPEIMEGIRVELNKLVAPYERIAKIQLIATEFEKTPKRSIKRYLYSS